MKFILVGDPHAKDDNREETSRLFHWVGELAQKHDAEIFVKGDLYDTHGVAKLKIQKFWHDTFMELVVKYSKKPYILSGNHDMDYECTGSWLSAHSEFAHVIDHEATYSIIDNKTKVAAIPYIRDNEKFIEIANKAAQDGFVWILCHQEFEGCQLDNRYYSPNGVKRDRLPVGVKFISGHIHKRQMLTSPNDKSSQIIYIGTPRQLTRSDIDEKKGVVLWDSQSGRFDFIDTPEDVAVPFRSYVITPENIQDIVPTSRTYVDIRGPKDFVKTQLAKLDESIKVRTFPDPERPVTAVKESDGIPVAFMNYMVEYCNQSGLTNADLKILVDRAYSRCPSLRGI